MFENQENDSLSEDQYYDSLREVPEDRQYEIYLEERLGHYGY